MRIFLTFVIAASSLSAFAQSKPFAPTVYREEIKITNYQANDAKKVFEWVQRQIARVPGKPDQFSSTEERQKYEAALGERMAAIGPLPFIGECEKKYDADSQTFKVETLLRSIQDYSIKSLDVDAIGLKRLSLSTTNEKIDKYQAQNAYGASVVVTRTFYDEYAFAFPDGGEPAGIAAPMFAHFTQSKGVGRAKLSYLRMPVPMAAAEARAIERNLSCLFVFALDAPYTLDFVDGTEATRDHPRKLLISGNAMFGRLERMVVFNKATGSVYAQVLRQQQ